MSDLFMGATILQSINSLFQWIMLFIDSVIYWFASQCYQLFIKLSMTQIFSENFFQNFANRIYAVLGVFMLFYLAYALLNALVDPDKLAKGDKSVSKLASNLVISLVILGLLPSIFQYAYRLQNYVLSSNIIGSLIFGTDIIDPNSDTDESMIRFGDSMSFLVLNTFLNPDNYNVRIDDNKTWYDVKYEILHDSNYGSITGLADAIAFGNAPVVTESGDGEAKQVEYKVILSSLAGIYLCYIMLSFTLDLGVRIVKLAFCQLIAPIPIILRATPGKKGTFDKWLKLTFSVYFEVFVRVAIMYISIYFINEIADSAIFGQFFSGGIQGMLAMVIVILGVLTFAKQAPKMISDVLGIDSGNLKFGIKDKLKAGGFFSGAAIAGVGSAMIGAGFSGLIRNGIKGLGNTWGDLKKHDFVGAAKSFGTGALSGIAGATSGMYNAYTNPKNMKSLKDVKKQAGIGAQKSTENREKRAAYIASHGGVGGAMLGHAKDIGINIGEWATGEKIGVLSPNKQHIYDVLSEYKSRVKNYEGLWKNEKQWIDAEAADRFAKAELQAFSNRSDILIKLNNAVQELKRNNKDLSMDDAVQQAMNSVYSAANNQERNELNRSISEYIDLARKSDEATNFLKATTQSIQSDSGKAKAMESMAIQIEAFRKAHKDMAEYIGEAGKNILPNDGNIKKSYTQKLNELDTEKAMAEIKKSEKK